MTAFAPVWVRESATSSDRCAEILLVCFAAGDLREDVKLQVDRFGVPTKDSIQQVDVRQHLRSDNPEWFDNWRTDACHRIAMTDLGDRIADLDAADRCFTLSTTVSEPTDLAYLQATWAIARWLVARGATVVLDAYGMRYIAGAELPPPGEFDVQNEVSMIFETDADEGAGGHVLHTRGMRKFGRPDVVTIVQPDEREMFAEILWQLAGGMAQGFLPALPKHGVDLDEATTLYLVADEGDRYASKLGLNNDARVLER